MHCLSGEQTATTELHLLTEPAGGIPPVIQTTPQLDRVAEQFADGNGPVAVDAERASGYRYGQRAYLVQLKRAGAGIALIDPIAFQDLSIVQEAIGDCEWVLHAASQDLPCLSDIGLHPASVFDTELAARLLGYPRVGLATMVAELLGVGLAKEHSAVDWSTRPLPDDWLAYAALDVEVLIELRDRLAEQLVQAGKVDWAEQEFEAVRLSPPAPPRTEPWRRTSGMHAIRDRRQLAIVRELWLARDSVARQRDVSPGRVLPDSALIAAAKAAPTTVPELQAIKPFNSPSRRRRTASWLQAITRARTLPSAQLPTMRAPASDGPPPPRTWAERNPAAASRLAQARKALAKTAELDGMPTENLLRPDVVRRLCWNPPQVSTEAEMSAALIDAGARPWQAEQTAGVLLEAITAADQKSDPGDNGQA